MFSSHLSIQECQEQLINAAVRKEISSFSVTCLRHIYSNMLSHCGPLKLVSNFPMITCWKLWHNYVSKHIENVQIKICIILWSFCDEMCLNLHLLAFIECVWSQNLVYLVFVRV